MIDSYTEHEQTEHNYLPGWKDESISLTIMRHIERNIIIVTLVVNIVQRI